MHLDKQVGYPMQPGPFVSHLDICQWQMVVVAIYDNIYYVNILCIDISQQSGVSVGGGAGIPL